jgi:hypothetical protein
VGFFVQEKEGKKKRLKEKKKVAILILSVAAALPIKYRSTLLTIYKMV